MSTVATERRFPVMAVVMGLAAMVVAGLVIASLLSANGWNPTALVKFTPEDPQAFEYAEGLLGNVVAAPGLGHDGKFYFSQAMDPFYLSPEEHAVYLDRPTYRAQRMLYPTLAGAFGLAGPEFIAWALIGVNILGIGIGTTITAMLAQDMGLSAIYGAAFVFNPGVLVSAMIDTAEVLATLFFVLAVLLLHRRKAFAASIALTASVLSRETMVIAVIGLVAYLLFRRRKLGWHLILPFAVPGAWWIYLRARLGSLTDSVQDTQAVGAPFEGFIGAFQRWISAPIDYPDLIMGVVLMTVAFLLVARTIKTPRLLGAMVIGFAGIAVLMVEPVWYRYFDSSRVVAPLVTAYVLLAAPEPMRGDGGLETTTEDLIAEEVL